MNKITTLLLFLLLALALSENSYAQNGNNNNNTNNNNSNNANNNNNTNNNNSNNNNANTTNGNNVSESDSIVDTSVSIMVIPIDGEGTTYYFDNDGDGYGDPSDTIVATSPPPGTVLIGTDCNDSDITIHPGADEFYDGKDNDCDGSIDEGLAPPVPPMPTITQNNGSVVLTRGTPPIYETWYWQSTSTGTSTANSALSITLTSGTTYYLRARNKNSLLWSTTRVIPYTIGYLTTYYYDKDSDGYGDPYDTIPAYTQPINTLLTGTDCDDGNSSIHPGATELYDNIDNDCDGSIDEGLTPPAPSVQTPTYNCGNTVLTRGASPNYETWYWQSTATGTDTSIENAYPTVTLTSGTVYYLRAKNNNNSLWSPATTINYTVTLPTLWYYDGDHDGLGDPDTYVSTCTTPANYVANSDDQCPGTYGTVENGGCPVLNYDFTDENYIYTLTPKVPVQDLAEITDRNDVRETITYYDGLGRPIQNIAYAQSPQGNDLVTHMEYDAFGRQTKEFLPYASGGATLSLYTGAATEVLNFYANPYYENTSNPYSEKLLENSPLNRLFKQAAPGNDWALNSGHEIKFDYQTNAQNEVLAYKAVATWNSSTKLYDIALENQTVFYEPNQLYKNSTWDENHAQGDDERTEEFKDKEGKVVLKRVFAQVGSSSGVETHDTYYVYDVYGNLTYVIPPAVVTGGTLSSEVLDGLCYQYKYDHRNRLAAKKIPGKQWEYIVYDKLDRVRATGPVLSPFKDATTEEGWLITKYDVFNRPVLTAWQNATVNETTRTIFQDDVDADTILSEERGNSSVNGISYAYTNTSTPTGGYDVLTVTYYDDYTYPNAPTDFSPVLEQTLRDGSNLSCKGLPTGSWVRMLENATEYRGNLSYTLYKNDRIATPVKVYAAHTDGGYTTVSSQTDFEGKVLQTVTKHKRTSAEAERSITEDFTYSPQGRILTHSHTIDQNPTERLAVHTYDALGQLITKDVGGQTSALQQVNYTYNIRGWLKGINPDKTADDLFSFKIRYNDPQNGADALYNGNISETYWKTNNDNVQRMYGYTYDGLNRLTEAVSKNADANITGAYNEALTYDKNGNIQTLTRTGTEENELYNTSIDNLKYFYNTDNKNLLEKVVDLTHNPEGFKDDANAITVEDDTEDDYTYDNYGNMTKDENKKIETITYNHLNLPKIITFEDGNSITYTYDAAGVKLKKMVMQDSIVTTTDYLSGFQYLDEVLQFFPTAEGYVEPTETGGYQYVYNYTDHLGNNRLSYTFDTTTSSLQIREENNYYPFGLKQKGYNDETINSEYKYKYNGKELQDELGLKMTAMDFRQYDNALGRFVGMDRLSEKTYNLSPYRFAFNNPNLFNDPSGLWEDVDGGWTTSDSSDISAFMSAYSSMTSGQNDRNKLDIYINQNKEDKSLKSSYKQVIKTEEVLTKFFGYSTLKTIDISNDENGIDNLVKELQGLKTLGYSFNSFIIDSHGRYTEPSFRIGNKLVSTKNISDIGVLSNFFENTNVYILACHAGGGADDILSKKFTQNLSNIWNAIVFTNRSWGPGWVFDKPLKINYLNALKSSYLDNKPNALKNRGEWLMAFPGKTSPTVIKDLTLNVGYLFNSHVYNYHF